MSEPATDAPSLVVGVLSREQAMSRSFVSRQSLLPTQCFSKVGQSSAKSFPSGLVALQQDLMAHDAAAKRAAKATERGDDRDQAALLVAAEEGQAGGLVRLGAVTLENYRGETKAAARRGVGSYYSIAARLQGERPGTAPAGGRVSVDKLFKQHLGDPSASGLARRPRPHTSSSFAAPPRPDLTRVVLKSSIGDLMGPGKYDARWTHVARRSRAADMSYTVQTGGHWAAEALGQPGVAARKQPAERAKGGGKAGKGAARSPAKEGPQAGMGAASMARSTASAGMGATSMARSAVSAGMAATSMARSTATAAPAAAAQPPAASASPTPRKRRGWGPFLATTRSAPTHPAFQLHPRTAGAHLGAYATSRPFALTRPRTALGQHYFPRSLDRDTARRLADPREQTPPPGAYFTRETWGYNAAGTVAGHEADDLHVAFPGTVAAVEDRRGARPRTAGGLTWRIQHYRPSSSIASPRAAPATPRPTDDAVRAGPGMRSGFLFNASRLHREERSPDPSRPATAPLASLPEVDFAVVVEGREVETHVTVREDGVEASTLLTRLASRLDTDADAEPDPADVPPRHQHLVVDAGGVAWTDTESGRPDVQGDPPGVAGRPFRHDTGVYVVDWQPTPSLRPGMPQDSLGLASVAALLPPDHAAVRSLSAHRAADRHRRRTAPARRPTAPASPPSPSLSTRPPSAAVTTRVEVVASPVPKSPGSGATTRPVTRGEAYLPLSPDPARWGSPGRWAQTTRDQAMRGQGHTNAELGTQAMYVDVEADIHGLGLERGHGPVGRPESPRRATEVRPPSPLRLTRRDWEEVARARTSIQETSA